jgi:hypothetical protein
MNLFCRHRRRFTYRRKTIEPRGMKMTNATTTRAARPATSGAAPTAAARQPRGLERPATAPVTPPVSPQPVREAADVLAPAIPFLKRARRDLWLLVVELIHFEVEVARIGKYTDLTAREPLHDPVCKAYSEFAHGIERARSYAISAGEALHALQALTKPANDPAPPDDEE